MLNLLAMNKISTQPYKGSRDFYPDEMQLRNYIFNIWREVCKSYGYKEYDGPFLESFELYQAKSGEELVNEQLYSFVDKGDRKIAIRPEMTPTLARMVAAQYKTLNFPVRWFSIPNLWRYEKPQRGRLREFFQLNVDVLGIDNVLADFEIISIAVSIMKKIGAKEGMFELRVNNRKLMEDFYTDLGLSEEQKTAFNKALDKKGKITEAEFYKIVEEKVNLPANQLKNIKSMLSDSQKFLDEMLSKQSQGAQEVKDLLKLVEDQNLQSFVKFDPSIVRGLAYYTGIVFEQFDLNPQNTRAMFGGGRYNDLVSIFIDKSIPATGFGMGDVTFMDFLKSWNLLPELESEIDYFIAWLPEKDEKKQAEYLKTVNLLADKLRQNGQKVSVWLEKDSKLEKQLKYANNIGAAKALILGASELKNSTVTVKNFKTQTQSNMPMKDFLK
jgi:histidyl-tRNA synthetase